MLYGLIRTREGISSTAKYVKNLLITKPRHGLSSDPILGQINEPAVTGKYTLDETVFKPKNLNLNICYA